MSCLKHCFRLKRKGQFDEAYASKTKWHSRYFVLFYARKDDFLVGFTASKKVGNSPERNFAKRRLKALALEYCDRFKGGSYVFVAKKEIIDAPYEEIKKEFKLSLERLSVLK